MTQPLPNAPITAAPSAAPSAAPFQAPSTTAPSPARWPGAIPPADPRTVAPLFQPTISEVPLRPASPTAFPWDEAAEPERQVAAPPLAGPGASAALPAGEAVVQTPPGTQQLPPTPTKADAMPVRQQSVPELVAFVSSTAGAGLAIASLFLPWAAKNGMGIGSTGEYTKPNDWGLGFPGAWPLMLLAALVLGGIAGSDRAQLELPKLATVIERVTDLVLPMILGGLYLGVVLMYASLPWGFGIGITVLLVAAGLLIAGSIVSLFTPQQSNERPK
jgi:hypothetical protein